MSWIQQPIEVNGVTALPQEHAERNGISWDTVRRRVIRNHWSVADAVSALAYTNRMPSKRKVRMFEDKTVIMIRKRRAEGMTLTAIANLCKTRIEVIRRLCMGDTYNKPYDFIALQGFLSSTGNGPVSKEQVIERWTRGMTEENKAKLVRYVDREIRRSMAQSENVSPEGSPDQTDSGHPTT